MVGLCTIGEEDTPVYLIYHDEFYRGGFDIFSDDCTPEINLFFFIVEEQMTGLIVFYGFRLKRIFVVDNNLFYNEFAGADPWVVDGSYGDNIPIFLVVE